MNIQDVIESLLRARLYRFGVRIRTEGGESHDVDVRDLKHEGSRSLVVVAGRTPPRREFTIPLAKIRDVTAGQPAPHAVGEPGT